MKLRTGCKYRFEPGILDARYCAKHGIVRGDIVTIVPIFGMSKSRVRGIHVWIESEHGKRSMCFRTSLVSRKARKDIAK